MKGCSVLPPLPRPISFLTQFSSLVVCVLGRSQSARVGFHFHRQPTSSPQNMDKKRFTVSTQGYVRGSTLVTAALALVATIATRTVTARALVPALVRALCSPIAV